MGLFQDPIKGKPCWDCEHWGGWDSSGCYAVCLYDDHVQITQAPEQGCAMWVRAIGADDEDDRLRSKGWTL